MKAVKSTSTALNGAFCRQTRAEDPLNAQNHGGCDGRLRTAPRTVPSEPDRLAPPAPAGDTSATPTGTGGTLLAAPPRTRRRFWYRLRSGAAVTFAPQLLGTARAEPQERRAPWKQGHGGKIYRRNGTWRRGATNLKPETDFDHVLTQVSPF